MAVLNEPIHSPFEVGKLVNQLGFQSEHDVTRDEADQRTDAHLLGPWSAPGYCVVVETVLFVPQAFLFSTSAERHGVGDQNEMFKELGCNVFVRPPVFSKFQSDVQHAQTIES